MGGVRISQLDNFIEDTKLLPCFLLYTIARGRFEKLKKSNLWEICGRAFTLSYLEFHFCRFNPQIALDLEKTFDWSIEGGCSNLIYTSSFPPFCWSA